jgi:hypothetical protein
MVAFDTPRPGELDNSGKASLTALWTAKPLVLLLSFLRNSEVNTGER